MPTGVLVAGPNGAGKSTLLLELGLDEGFERILADHLSQQYQEAGLPRGIADIRAMRVCLRRLKELLDEPTSFVHETTLSGGFFGRFIPRFQAVGFDIRLIFVGLRNADTAVARVESRVRGGGHPVEEATVRSRWARGLEQFFNRCRYVADSWNLVDNQFTFLPVAQGGRSGELDLAQPDVWDEYLAIVASLH